MRKNFLCLFVLLAALSLPVITQAQTDKSTPQGSHGGMIIGEGTLRFEMVEKGTQVSFYPVDAKGKAITAMDVTADVVITTPDRSNSIELTSIPFTEGAYTVDAHKSAMPVAYSISCQYKGETSYSKMMTGVIGR